jgi:hypothetical protein
MNDTGKTAPRLIKDLQDYDPRYLPQNVRNLLVDPAPIYKGTSILRKGVRDCRHVLMRKDEQTTAIISNGDRPRVGICGVGVLHALSMPFQDLHGLLQEAR